ncbi:MAG: RNA 2',3'-cyclic phosphodiesterase [Bdellovibrionales bacterium CG12_big_fil_rev_8_21_14_0_65_38_15]|nr:MAG: RNA 2',3'-cyclic phosphodiesterase [Bdellovibrionales bacterium CG22_combo_CG10-13_8_21_14_all_38_13]PIQ53384.1 MAG: RNA 2',3'-cyclic phosphodiesterase [Bdellovibrionales bacterium CG12_big_fil_rev_8_21_14_0_65_38_15]PIR30253.1 MAG: RNA 2',3'-cyclic phosphodiesterase [Bdellovibrionales bacterium CG11_big_fil_rev_8_21_14_0_20_38_13]
MVKIGRGLNRCEECQVPKELCYCQRLIHVENKTRVSIIMHRRERFLTSNTAVVANRVLKNCEIILRGMKDQSASKELIINDDSVPLVLFPSDDALAIGSKELTEYLAGRPAHLIVPDGSWGQAKRVAKREPALQNVQAVKLAAASPSLYRLRRQVAQGRLCTFEAIARALGDLEGEQIEKDLMVSLAAMDHAHAMARGVDKYDNGNPDPLTPRLFVGIRLGLNPSFIKDFQNERPEYDWVIDANYHLTLCFIGRVRRSQKEKLVEALTELEYSKFDLTFKSIDAFDSKEHPCVLWIKPEHSPELLELAARIRETLKNLGIPLDFKAYTPHWTIARTRGNIPIQGEIDAWFNRSFSLKSHIDRFILFEGHGTRPVYEESFSKTLT